VAFPTSQANQPAKISVETAVAPAKTCLPKRSTERQFTVKGPLAAACDRRFWGGGGGA
jgi:hypothetical protein